MTSAGVELVPMESSESAERHRFEYNQDTTAASMAVVAALAVVSGTDPIALPPLFDAIDPDALDAVMSGREAESDAIEITLPVAAYTVTVSGDGVIAVSPSAVERQVSRGVRKI